MVIQTNEKEFKGKTLQEYLEWKYSTKEVRGNVGKIDIREINCDRRRADITEKLEGGELDLREFKNLTDLVCRSNKLTSLNVSGLSNLIRIRCPNNNLTSVDFLNALPNPEKLEDLLIFNNNIQPTDISIFSKFVNLKELRIGTMDDVLKEGKHNKFYGSFKSYQNLTKLKEICIEATDVNEGLEYLPMSLAKATRGGFYLKIECSPHNTNAKCVAIQNELRPFSYDLEAWQLAHPEKMLIGRPEYFTEESEEEKEYKKILKMCLEYKERILKGEKVKHEGKEVTLEDCEKVIEDFENSLKEPTSITKWINALKNKLEESKKELSETDREKIKRIARLETKISELEQAKSTISQQTQTEFQTQNKSTQTDLTGEQIKQWEQENKNKTLYQNFIDKYGKK